MFRVRPTSPHRRRHGFLAAGLTIALLTGCLYSVTYTTGGYHREGVFLPGTPPVPPQPKVKEPPTEGLDLVWRPELGVYEVSGHAGRYYRLLHFFRCQDGEWQVADTLEGPWRRAGEQGFSDEALPVGLERLDC